MESILTDHVTEHLHRHNLIGQTQLRFRYKKATTTNMLQFLEEITKIHDKAIPVDVLYLDFAKALDTVPKKRLISKF